MSESIHHHIHPSNHHENWEDHPHHHQRRRIPPVPDLRFEQSYLRSVRPYVHVELVERKPDELPRDEKGKVAAEPEDYDLSTRPTARKQENIQVQWANVLWVTTKDQILSPLIQGALWCVYQSSDTITPSKYERRYRCLVGGSPVTICNLHSPPCARRSVHGGLEEMYMVDGD